MSDLKLVLAKDLKSYFFQNLNELNNKSLCPVPQETIFYSSVVLDRFALSASYFDLNEGRVREKILGMKLLEAGQLSSEAQKRTYQEVGDMALMICGYFSESVNKKIVDLSYYAQIGKTAYGRLNNYDSRFLDVPDFYQIFASSFENVTTLINILAAKTKYEDPRQSLFEKAIQGTASEQEMLAGGILPLEKKVS
ncbi:MAG: hypothetical protein K2P81_06815 [Bacteriovoracaceae bacterium]|nr:hypothetical protein [Bacteriovoracaceae bacterium]